MPIPVWHEDACIPRKEVLEGTLVDSDLALSLQAVTKRKARPPYDNPESFFKATYMTKAMKKLIEDISGKLSGVKKDVNPIIRLDVGMGGGKTHTLVTLYYLAKYPLIARKYIPEATQIPQVKVVAISGDEYGSLGLTRENQEIRTIWGDIFYQLGVYNKFRKYDVERALPSLDDVRLALEGAPALILLDELPTYFKAASLSGLKDATVQFIQRLVTAVSEKGDAVMVVAIAEDVYREEAEESREALALSAKEAMEEAKAHMRRRETVLTPVMEEDAVHVLKRFLFEHISNEVGQEIADGYHKLYKDLGFIDEWKRTDYKNLIAEYYPFHPELIKVLYNRVSTLEKFQRTRGALRLLLKTIRWIWKQREIDALLIHPFHVDLSSIEIKNELTSQIEEGKRDNAIVADVWSNIPNQPAKAQKYDEEYEEHWHVPLFRRVCNTVYLYSLGAGKQLTLGILPNELAAICTTPSNPEHYRRIGDTVFTHLIDSFEYIDRRGERYAFVLQPTPVRVIENISRDVESYKVKQKIIEKLNNLFSDGPDWIHVEIFPMDPGELPDEKFVKFAILEPQMYYVERESGRVPEDVSEFFEYRDSSRNKPRQYTNSTFLLVASKDRVQQLYDDARKVVGAEIVGEDPTRYSIELDRKKDIEEYLTRKEAKLFDSLRYTYNNLIYMEDRNGVKSFRMDSSTFASATKGKTMLEYFVTKILSRVVTKPLDPAYLKEYVWGKGNIVSTEFLENQLHSVPGLILTSTRELFQESIKNGVQNNYWVLRNQGYVYISENLPSVVPIAASSELIATEEAEKLGLLGKGEQITEAVSVADTKTRIPNVEPQRQNQFNLGTASLESILGDVQKLARRGKFTGIRRIELSMDANPKYMQQIKNIFTSLSPEKEINITFDFKILKSRSPNYSISASIAKEDFQNDDAKSIIDLGWRIKLADTCSLRLTFIWEKGVSPEKLTEILQELATNKTLSARAEIYTF